MSDESFAPTLEPVTLRRMNAYARQRAGEAWAEALKHEAGARRAWVALAQQQLSSAGTRQRTALVLSRAQDLIDGDESRLARAARRQRRPWDLSAEPMKSTLAQLGHLISQADDLRTIVGETVVLIDEFRRLESAHAMDLPGAWKRWRRMSGISEESLDRAQAREELSAVRYWLGIAAIELPRWRAEMEAWLAEHEPDAAYTPASKVTTAQLETRYEMLLAAGRIDRGPMLERNGSRLREVVRAHLAAIALSRVQGKGGALTQIAGQFLDADIAPSMSAEEFVTVETALSEEHLARRASKTVVV